MNSYAARWLAPLLLAALGTVFVDAHAQAAASTVVVDLAGVPVVDQLDAPANLSLTYTLAPGWQLQTLSYSTTIQTFAGSWLSDVSILISNSDGQGFVLFPALDVHESGTASFSGSVDLLDLGLSLSALGDGRLTLQFFDLYDDLPGAPDAVFTAGSLSLTGVVPEPSTWFLMLAGLAGVAGRAMRRSRDG